MNRANIFEQSHWLCDRSNTPLPSGAEQAWARSPILWLSNLKCGVCHVQAAY